MNDDANLSEEAAELAARAFEQAGERIEKALIKAARTGELSFSDMAESILRDLAKIAAQQLITNPLEQLISGIGGGVTTPSNAVNITMNVSGVSDGAGLTRSLSQSQGQISSALARAVSDGTRFL